MKRQQRVTSKKLPPVSEAERLDRAMAYLREHFTTATLPELGAAAGLSMFHFHRRFSAWAGRTPKAVQSELQIEQAKRLMADADVPLVEIAARCGFAHQSHFTSRFRDLVGTTPARWRRERAMAKHDRPAARAA